MGKKTSGKNKMGFAQGEEQMKKEDLTREANNILPRFKKIAETSFGTEAGSGCVYITLNGKKIGNVQYRNNSLVFEFHSSHPDGKKIIKLNALTNAKIKDAIFNTPMKPLPRSKTAEYRA